MIILGIIMYIFGTIGNILNICVFFRWCHMKKRSNGQSNSSLYLLVCSVSNLIIIIYPLLTRIIFDGFHYSVQTNSVFFLCKFRYYILHTFDSISLTCICLATFDRYLITSRKVHLRHLNPATKRIEQVLLVFIILYSIHSIPIGIYFHVSNHGRCMIYSPLFLYYYFWIFQIFFHSIFPIIFLSVFGTLTFQQLKSFKRKTRHGILNSEKQLSRMLLLMSIAIILSSIPYCIEHIYLVMIVKHNSLQRTSYVFLYHVITSILFYTNPTMSFYIFFISTPNFRKQVRRIIFGKRPIQHLTKQTFSMITPSHTSPN